MKKIILSMEAGLLDSLMILSVPFCPYHFVLEPFETMRHKSVFEQNQQMTIMFIIRKRWMEETLHWSIPSNWNGKVEDGQRFCSLCSREKVGNDRWSDGGVTRFTDSNE